MKTITVTFPQRIRLMQLVGGYQAIGTPVLREVMRLLDKIEFSKEEAALVDLVVDIPKDFIGWNTQKVEAESPSYAIALDPGQAGMLKSILAKATLSPLQDRWLLAIADILEN